MTRRDHLVRRPAAWLSLVTAVGCTTILEIDGRYVAIGSDGGRASHPPDASTGGVDSGRVESGGAGGTGGLANGGSESGGAPGGAGGGSEQGGTFASGGETASSGGSTSEATQDCSTTGCPKGEKCCGSTAVKGHTCYVPSPLVGCDDTGCDHCSDPVPTNSTPSCSAEKKCAFACDPGFTEESAACVAISSGGAGNAGAGGKTGSGGRTSSGGNPATCKVDTDCSVRCGGAGPFPCCMLNHVCGCTYFQLQVGSAPPFGYCLPLPPGF